MSLNLSKNEPCPHCGRFANRGVTIDAIIVKNDKILLIKRGAEPDKGKWGTPGGYVDWDETVEDAVEREVREELGLGVKSLKFIGQYSNPSRHPKQTINSAFAVETTGKIQLGDDARDFKWFPLDNLPEMAFDHQQIVKDYLAQK